MSKITYHHHLQSIPTRILVEANKIKNLSYQITDPGKFKRDELIDDDIAEILSEMFWIDDCPEDLDKLNVVFFSCANGAEEHVDKLDPEVFTSTTYVIPVILPSEGNILHVDGESMEIEIGGIYEFNHEIPHSLTVGDTTGAVVIMIGVMK